MRKFISGICMVMIFFLVSGGYTTHAREYSFKNSISTSGIDQYCEISDSKIVTCEGFETEFSRLEKKVDKLFVFMKNMNRFDRDRLLSQFPKAFEILGSISARSTNKIPSFQARYIHSVFLDIYKYFDFRDNSLQLSQQLLSIHGNQELSKQGKHDQIRRYFIGIMIQKGFRNFTSKPFAGESVVITTLPENWKQYVMNTIIISRDSLDVMIDQWLSSDGTENLYIYLDDLANGEPVQLFKSQQDLEALGYQVISHRMRTSQDKDYRRYNIAKSFSYIGRVRIINPGETLSFLKDSKFDLETQSKYMTGKVIFLDEEVDGYGGGLCGGSTALYQGIIYNKGIKLASRTHSKWYNSLYSATINGTTIKTPGLDSTIYSPSLDLQLTNVTNHPIVLVLNFDGNYGSVEEIFTLGFEEDQGTVEFIKSWGRSYTIQTSDGSTRDTAGKCYEWQIHGESKVSCYKEIF